MTLTHVEMRIVISSIEVTS